MVKRGDREYVDLRIRVDRDTHEKLRVIGYVLSGGMMWGALRYAIMRAIREFIERYEKEEEVRRRLEALRR